ncbi:MAG: hypothetical protein MJZ76_07705 [Bacteroidales bacterium]|nr:hypothetical protein [Bacteroidales bacterium]
MIAIIIGIAIAVVVVIFVLVVKLNDKADEVSELTQKFTDLTSQYVSLQQINENLQKQVGELEYQKYKLQAQSHTLKNLAQSVQSSIQHLYKNASNITEIMSILTYDPMNSTRDMCSVKEEVEKMKKYVHVLHDAKSNMANYEIDTSKVDVNSPYYDDDNSIVELVSLPLIENAFQHGDLRDPDFLKVRFSLYGNIFSVEVITKPKAQDLSGSVGKYRGMGLSNLREKLDLLYPCDGYELKGEAQGDVYWAWLSIKIDHLKVK